ncbi:MAG: MaoC/PaaZ C-terminal domain-containing protein [Pseudomonadota bacterium]|nr:MaoC/PaaZ C-terminal domain-containing protein [Pseudomonadota bacterium]
MKTITLNSVPSNFKLYTKALMPKKTNPKADTLPDITYQLKNSTIDAEHVKKYNKTCGFKQDDYVPACYPFLLAMPLVTSLVLEDRFPFKAMGMVHLSNEITIKRKLFTGDVLDLKTYCGEIQVQEKGRVVPFYTEARRLGRVVWLCKTEIFFFGGGHKNKEDKPQTEALQGESEIWSLKEGLGREYAGVSGDRNPIHLYPITAKAFGFKRHIIHGMWTKARVEAALAEKLPEQFTLRIDFKTPVFLPSKVRFTQLEGDGGIEYDIYNEKGEKPHARGFVSFGAGDN